LLASEVGEQYANSYLKWQAVEELDAPLIILVGGATGVGKSTLATRLAVRLGITRVTSTDAIREVLRAAFSEELMPTLYASSYEADSMLRVPVTKKANPLIIGFQRQVATVAVGMKALISRAMEEGTDIIVEGAHVVPGFLDGWEQEFKEAVLVPMVVAVSDGKLHRSHFYRRAAQGFRRPLDRYLMSFDKIRTLQSYIKQLALERGVPVLEAVDLDTTLQEMVGIVLEKSLEHGQARLQEPTLVPVTGDGKRPFEPMPEPGAEEPAPSKPRTPSTRIRGWQPLAGRRRR
jgi:2-phosphoglycerate kinase